MSVIGNIATFYEDEGKTKPVFPITKVNAITNQEGMGLEAILQGIVDASNEKIQYGSTDILPDSDLLSGHIYIYY